MIHLQETLKMSRMKPPIYFQWSSLADLWERALLHDPEPAGNIWLSCSYFPIGGFSASLLREPWPCLCCELGLFLQVWIAWGKTLIDSLGKFAYTYSALGNESKVSLCICTSHDRRIWRGIPTSSYFSFSPMIDAHLPSTLPEKQETRPASNVHGHARNCSPLVTSQSHSCSSFCPFFDGHLEHIPLTNTPKLDMVGYIHNYVYVCNVM